MINGEKAAVNNPVFAQKRERTLEMLIKNMHEEYITEVNKVGKHFQLKTVTLNNIVVSSDISFAVHEIWKHLPAK